MDPIIQNLALQFIKPHEGYRRFSYMDTVGILTIGYGRNLVAKGLSEAEASTLLLNDINEAVTWLSTYSWWNSLSNNRKACLIDMGMNLGEGGFKHLVHMIAAIASGNFKEAANQMINSSWYHQTGNGKIGTRSGDDVNLMING